MIPANITNVAMAEALAALQEVVGIEEFLNPIESESQLSEEKIEIGTPGNSRTACRTSTRRKPVKEPPTTQSIIRTRRGRVGEMADQENKDLNISSTPSFPSNRRRAPVPSARKKLETHSIEVKEEENDQNNEDRKRTDVLETPSMPKTQGKVSVLGTTRRKTEASVQGACSTRRSMRLLEKNMENLSLMECGNVEPVAADKLFDELPERKEFCVQKINGIDSKLNVYAIGGNVLEKDDPECMHETEDKEEKVQMEDENEEDNTITDHEPRDEIQSEAAIEEQHALTPSCNEEFSTENFSREKVIPAQSPLLQEKADLYITVQHEVLKENSEMINEEKVEFNIEDLVDVNCNVNAQDSVSEPKMEVQVLSDVAVLESELVENFDSNDSFPEPNIEESDEILVVNILKKYSEEIDSSFTPFAVDQISGQFPRPTAEVSVKESITSHEIFNSADQDEDMKNNCNVDENLSLRQLKKMIKELHLSKKSGKEKTHGKEQVENVVRTALQTLSENCLAKEGQEKTTTVNSGFI